MVPRRILPGTARISQRCPGVLYPSCQSSPAERARTTSANVPCRPNLSALRTTDKGAQTHVPCIYPKASAFEAAGSGVTASPKFPTRRGSPRLLEEGQHLLRIRREPPRRRKRRKQFVFYDGPPFANGLPHYGHLLTGYAKDLVARYQTQRGHKVERRFGWIPRPARRTRGNEATRHDR